MKNYSILFFSALFCLMLSFIGKVQAQKNALKFNIISPYFHTINGSMERALNHWSSLQLSAYYTFDHEDLFPKLYFSESTEIIGGSAVSLDYRLFLAGEGMTGFFLSPFIRNKYQTYILTGSDYSGPGVDPNLNKLSTASAFGGGILIGNQGIFRGIAIDMFIGPYYEKIYKLSGNRFKYNFYYIGGYGIKAGINVGFAF